MDLDDELGSEGGGRGGKLGGSFLGGFLGGLDSAGQSIVGEGGLEVGNQELVLGSDEAELQAEQLVLRGQLGRAFLDGVVDQLLIVAELVAVGGDGVADSVEVLAERLDARSMFRGKRGADILQKLLEFIKVTFIHERYFLSMIYFGRIYYYCSIRD